MVVLFFFKELRYESVLFFVPVPAAAVLPVPAVLPIPFTVLAIIPLPITVPVIIPVTVTVPAVPPQSGHAKVNSQTGQISLVFALPGLGSCGAFISSNSSVIIRDCACSIRT